MIQARRLTSSLTKFIPIIATQRSQLISCRYISSRLSSTIALQEASIPTESIQNAIPKYTIVNHPIATDEQATNDSFAIIRLGGTQYKVTEGDIIIAEKIKNAKVGEIMSIDEVLLWGNLNRTVVGRPLVQGAKVRARIEEQTVDAKIDIFKKKRRKNYRRWNGYRREVTVLRVTEIVPHEE